MIIQYLLIALYYGFLAGGPFYIVSNPLREPVVIGLVVGLILGNPIMGTTIGAYIGLVYLGAITIGDQMPSNRMVGAIVGVTFAIVTASSYEAGLAIAVPLGVVTANLRNWVETLAVAFGSRIPKAALEHNEKRMWLWTIINGMFKFTFYSVFMFLVLQLGISAMANVFDLLPDWILNGLNVAGSVMPAVGLALGLVAIGGRGKIFLAIASFIATKALGLSTLQCILFVMCLLVVSIYQKIDRGELSFGIQLDEEERTPEKKKRILSFKDVLIGVWNSANISWGEEMSKNNGNNFLLAMYTVLKKLYPDDIDRRFDELSKHDMFINLFPPFMGLISGPVIMMEEERALGNDAITATSIQGFKASMQGPAMALGDALGSGVVLIILNTVGISLAQNGNPIGSVITFVGEILFSFLLCYFAARMSYKHGSVLIRKIYNEHTAKFVTDTASIIGCVAFGSLISRTVSISASNLVFLGVGIQEALFDAILPGLLPLALVLICYKLLIKKKLTVVQLIGALFLLCFVLGSLGILC